MSQKQGKLYQKIRTISQPVPLSLKGQEPVLRLVQEVVTNLIDDATADFPFNIYFDNAVGGENHYSFCKKGGSQIEDISEVTRGVAEWLERNFYGVKEKKGLYLVNRDDSKTSKP
jgi:hypothetical protein